MAIDLTTSEKATFFRFLLLYLGSSFILIFLVAFFYFQSEKTLYFDLIKSNMQNKVSQISSKIIFAHMKNIELKRDNLWDSSEYEISFYDENKKKLFGNFDEKIDFSKSMIENKKHFILIDTSTLGHLDVFYIVIKEKVFFRKVSELKTNIALVFLLIYSFISLIGFYLAKLFLKPIKDEREKLNNFIKDTTHEINTPISAILMSTETDKLSEKQIHRIRISAKRISEMYKDLTYIFLENNNEKEHEIQSINLKEIIEEQVEFFEPLITKKKLIIKIELNNFIYKINKDDFIRLFNNLLSNAIKYNKMSGALNIELKENKLTIKDTGIGIQKNKVKDIFNRYYRGTSQEGGFGIGLSIVKQICDNYEIKIKVESQINKGTSFILTF